MDKVERKSITASSIVMKGYLEHYNTILGMCYEFRPCYDTALQVRMCRSAEKARAKLVKLIPKAQPGGESQLLCSGFSLGRCLEHFIAGSIALKQDRQIEAWQHLADAEHHLDRSISCCIPEGALEIVRALHTRINGVMENCFPSPTYQSVSYESETECSICNAPIVSCNHDPGSFYDGRLCERVAKDIRIREISIVTVPKDRGCVVDKMVVDDKLREVYTGRTKRLPKGWTKQSLSACAARTGQGNDPRNWVSLIKT